MNLPEVLEQIKNGRTYYDRENGVQVVSVVPVLLHKDLCVYRRDLSDGTGTIFVLYQEQIRNPDSWRFWCLSESQAELLAAVTSIYKTVDAENGKVRS